MSVLLDSSDSQGDRRKRCHQCNGHFGLVRRRSGLKQFCSKACLENYRHDAERKIARIKNWIEFLDQKH